MVQIRNQDERRKKSKKNKKQKVEKGKTKNGIKPNEKRKTKVSR